MSLSQLTAVPTSGFGLSLPLHSLHNGERKKVCDTRTVSGLKEGQPTDIQRRMKNCRRDSDVQLPHVVYAA